MEDYLIKALAFDGQIRAFAVNATETVSEAQRRHDTWHSSSAALGRSLVAGLLLGSQLKGEDKLTVKIEGNGPGGLIMVDANGKGEVKGYITNPHVALPLNEKGKIDVRGVVGTEGTLTVIKDLGMKEPFSGQVPLISGELGEDFTYYLANSEQVPSAVGLSVLVAPDESIIASGGFMIQVMPGATEETLSEIERRLSEIPFVSRLIEQGEQPEEILNRLLGEENVHVLDKMDVGFKCQCSKDRFGAMLMTLGVKELQEVIEEDHGAETVCHFCNNKYHFSEDDLNELITEIQA
ncbi:Hsp33 family molecular chaperone HslO [Vagococcus xieshaowenii]|uniref:33 kDa chaperonin n=1 Tax=Vagococcus xieshaowenii TaxID=2562451 RepID=A0AAJ5JL09_9ENTE|nr:Hsp33 family molecular chaperone HslO [Vagococcus xieshaowenii]QCA28031.1 Hsp33 family molecular chaperone HslO [Vagococcus xieshaowenii]TFZ40309.1 Hsp33 family molecular chaperone HslO [Vagococcus xieshaowenii]